MRCSDFPRLGLATTRRRCDHRGKMSAGDTTMSWLLEEVQKPFDLRDDPLIRVILAKVSSEPCVHFLLINMHHAVTDGRSLAILRYELSTAYNQQLLKQAVQLPPLSMQYADFAYWQRQWMAQGRLEKELEYWRVQLQGLPALQVPTDYPRPATLPLDGGQGLRVEQVELERTAALFDITCEMQVYNRHLWNVARAERFGQAFQALATAVAEQPTAELLSLPVGSRVPSWIDVDPGDEFS
eukprot:Skav200701  [mRNA]  locus=scaffold2650:173:9005:- [translate_table: standard]